MRLWKRVPVAAGFSFVLVLATVVLGGCTGSGYPPVPFNARYDGPQGLTPVFVLEDGFAYWWFESEPEGEVVFVNPATFEELVLDPKTHARIHIALDGSRTVVDARTGKRISADNARGMSLRELWNSRFTQSTVEAPIGWRERVREAREHELAQKNGLEAARERNRVARSVETAQESGGPSKHPQPVQPAQSAEKATPAPIAPAEPPLRPMAPVASPLFPALP